jgi:hypothetical protein
MGANACFICVRAICRARFDRRGARMLGERLAHVPRRQRQRNLPGDGGVRLGHVVAQQLARRDLAVAAELIKERDDAVAARIEVTLRGARDASEPALVVAVEMVGALEHIEHVVRHASTVARSLNIAAQS